MSLFRYFGREKVKAVGDTNNLEATKKDDDQSNATGVAKSTAELGEAQESSRKRCRTFQESWKTRRPWLKLFDEKENAMFCSYCRQFSKDKSAFGSEKGNNSFRLDGIKKHVISEANCKTLKTFELSFLASFCGKVFICEVPTSNFFSCYYTVMFVDFYNTNTNGQKQRDTGWSKHLRYSWIQFTVFVFHFLVQINKSHCLATCISFLAWTGARAWTTKIFYRQPNQVLWLPQGQLDIKVNYRTLALKRGPKP